MTALSVISSSISAGSSSLRRAFWSSTSRSMWSRRLRTERLIDTRSRWPAARPPPAGAPAAGVRERRRDYDLYHRVDKRRLLHLRDEASWRHHAALRML